jgi:hypothetical protein
MPTQVTVVQIDYCQKVLPLLGVCSGRTNKIWLRHIHSFKAKLTATRGRSDKRLLIWECCEFWINHGGSFHVKQQNGFSLPLQDKFYGYSMTKKALIRALDRLPKSLPPPSVPVAKAKENKKKHSLHQSSSRAPPRKEKDLPMAKEKENQKKQSLHPKSSSTPRRSPRKKEVLPVVKGKGNQKMLSLRRSPRKKRDLPEVKEQDNQKQLFLHRPPPRGKKDPPLPRSLSQSLSRVVGTTTIHHIKKKSNESWNFIIPPPKARATQRLTAVQRTALENFGLQEGMIERATDLYFWWTSNLVASEKRLNKWKLSEKKMRKSMPFVQRALKFHEMIKSCMKLYETKRGMIVGVVCLSSTFLTLCLNHCILYRSMDRSDRSI